MQSINRVTLIGLVGKDPEFKSFANGGEVCNFSLATSESWKDKLSGEWKDKTEWHNISTFNKNIMQVIRNHIKKGSKVYLEGKITTEKSGDKYYTKISLPDFSGVIILLDSKNDSVKNENKSTQLDLIEEIPF